MKDSDYIIITPELQALFAPRQNSDEVLQHSGAWMVPGGQNPIFIDELTYRRLRSRAWLPIKDKPVQYPCWFCNRLADDESVVYASNAMDFQNYLSLFTDWQPAPSAPEPPTNPDEEAFLKWIDKTAYGTHQFKDCWQAALNYERSKTK